ncbi:alpha/beta fold hydrolase [Streptomyces sp. NPDC048057]|uniref:thioesterase II family protein n=1 Tax=Streptomyces sp. NPDC048057 TaxID=3155628 RepID=UPI0033DD04D7
MHLPNAHQKSLAHQKAASDWYRCYVPQPAAKVRMFCFPHAGGAASYYRGWGREARPGAELLVAQYPGREDRLLDDPIGDLNELADLATGALLRSADRPYVLFGHSMGALVAFEVALRMAQSGRPPLHLVVSAQNAPGRRTPSALHLADDVELLRELDELGGTNAQVTAEPELLELLLPALRSDYRAVETYRPRPAALLTCPVTAVYGDRDPHVDVAGMDAWSEVTAAGAEALPFDGDHFYLRARAPELLATIAARTPGWGQRSI